jgi:hypothetical protein
MFEKLGRAAESMATNVSLSRRGFLGGLGQAALVSAAAVGGVLLLPGAAAAGGNGHRQCFCGYVCANGTSTGYTRSNCSCAPTYNGCSFSNCVCTY